MPPRPGERRRTGGEGGISSQLGKASRRKALEGKGPRNGVETGVVAGESGENKSGGLLRRAVRDGCYEFDCPPAGPSLPPHAIFHPVFRFFVSPILAFEISPPVFQPLRPTGRNSVCAKPLQIKSRRERSGGWVASIFRSLHLRLSGTTQVARGENLFDDRSQTGRSL